MEMVSTDVHVLCPLHYVYMTYSVWTLSADITGCVRVLSVCVRHLGLASCVRVLTALLPIVVDMETARMVRTHLLSLKSSVNVLSTTLT